jgi:circadian clock protein KaiA
LLSRLAICTIDLSADIRDIVTKLLGDDRYSLTDLKLTDEDLDFVEQHKEEIDCLIVPRSPATTIFLNRLYERGILLPAVILESEKNLFPIPADGDRPKPYDSPQQYHSSEILLDTNQLEDLANKIDLAIAQFLNLAPSCAIIDRLSPTQDPLEPIKDHQTFLLLQQRRLAEKLRERLGYLGVYYKRNPKYFYHNLSKEDRQELLNELIDEYREIILLYFTENTTTLNQAIDQFVNRAFFADISVSQILEIHMELIDEFAQQLKLEGRSDEILLDYRLTLIDMIAHLCEMYRRSIPREDLPFELLFRID